MSQLIGVKLAEQESAAGTDRGLIRPDPGPAEPDRSLSLQTAVWSGQTSVGAFGTAVRLVQTAV